MAEQVLTEIPEGTDESDVVKPVALAKELSTEGNEMRPQIVYGWIRNSGLPAHTKGGEGRYILRSEFAQWQEERAEKKAERERKRQEKEAKAAEKAAKVAAGEDVSDDEEDEDYEG